MVINVPLISVFFAGTSANYDVDEGRAFIFLRDTSGGTNFGGAMNIFAVYFIWYPIV